MARGWSILILYCSLFSVYAANTDRTACSSLTTNSLLFRRTPTSYLDPNYYLNSIEAAEFFQAWLNRGPVELPEFYETLRRMHQISGMGAEAALRKGEPRTYVARAGYNTKDFLHDLGQFRRRHERGTYHFMTEYVRRLSKQFGFRVVQNDTIKVPGIPDNDLPFVNGASDILFPFGAHTHLYMEQAFKQLEILQAVPKHSPVESWVRPLATYYHSLIVAHLFKRINHSMLSTQVNVILVRLGHKPVPHGWIDIVAYYTSTEDFIPLFEKHLRGELPLPEDFGLQF